MASVAMGIFLSTIDGSIVNVALPTLERVFQTNFAAVQWVVLAYLLTVTTLMLSVGRLADMQGKKRIYLSGFAVFTLGSVLCAISWNIYALIGFRVLQAIGASMVMALGTAILTESFPPTERGRALGIGGAMVSIGIVTGPTVGGLLLDAFSWHWIFLVNLPVGIVGLLLGLRNLPDLRPAVRQPFDFAGAFSLFAGLMGLLLALTLGQGMGYRHPLILGLFGLWLVMLALFLWIERRVRYPMINLSMFRNAQFSTNLGTGFLVFISTSGATILIPFLLQGVMGYDVRTVGLMMGVIPFGLGVMAPIAGAMSDRFGSRPITVIGLAIVATGFYSASTLNLDTSITGYVLRFLPIGIGLGTFQSPNNSAVMGAAPRENLGVASGLLAITRTMGQVTGVAIMGAFWAGRVAAHSGARVASETTQAPPEAQLFGFQDTFVLMALLVVVALAFAVRALWLQRRLAHQAHSTPLPRT
ncbi:MAG: MFS transporter [Caldilineaceae bacterium]|nr:MFS transporter [Caldilineaceae bacterium]